MRVFSLCAHYKLQFERETVLFFCVSPRRGNLLCFIFFSRFVFIIYRNRAGCVVSPTSSISQKGTDEPLFPSFTLSQGLTASSTVIFLHSGFNSTPAAEFVTVWGRRRSKTTAVSHFRRSAPAVIHVLKVSCKCDIHII